MTVSRMLLILLWYCLAGNSSKERSRCLVGEEYELGPVLGRWV